MGRLWLALGLVGCTGFQSTTTPPLPRLVAPLSTSVVTSARPTLRFTVPPPLRSPAVDVCDRRSCDGMRLAATVDGSGTSAVPDKDLAPGVWYWRVRAGSSTSAVWQLQVQPTGAGGTSWGSHLDLDGDGFDDLAVGAPWAMRGDGVSTGRVYLYAGGANGPDPALPQVLDGPDGSSQFGESLAAVDFDADGFADLAVGAPTSGPHGLVYVFRGGPGGLQRPAAFVLESDDATGLGWSLDCAGDVDGDGYGDLVSGAPTSLNSTSTVTGGAFVFFGGASNPRPIQPLFPDTGNHESVGFGVAGGGDLNGDGLSDLLVGAPRASTSAGRVFIYFGRAGGPNAMPLTFAASPPSLAQLGTAVAEIGDTDGDGRSDLAIAAPALGPGRVYVAAGGAAPTTINTVDGPGQTGSNFGATLAAGDLDGDGRTDLVVGATCAPGSDPTCPGAVYLLVGGTLTTIPAPPGVVSYGTALSTGDLDGDGHPDLAIGASETGNQLGRVDWYHNAAAGAVPRVFNGTDVGGRFGFAVR
jgi:hypothetical protein